MLTQTGTTKARLELINSSNTLQISVIISSPMFEQHASFERRLIHDMRNPLSGIVLYTQLLQKRGEYNVEQQQFLGLIYEEAQRMRILLDQMQLLHKLQQGRHNLHRQLTDLRVLLHKLIATYQPTLAAQERPWLVSIPNPPLPQLLINRLLIQHLLEILLSHAARFTPVEAQLTVEMAMTFSATPKQTVRQFGAAPFLQITITDQGPPIPEQVLLDLHEYVEKWDVVVAERAGMGVSLALCRMIADIHEGTLSVANHTLRGVSFTLTLPIPEREWLPYQ
jgi:two-component system, sensor histidine kinase and response regulator